MHGELLEENLQYQKRIESYDYNGQWNTEIGQKSNEITYVGAMKAGFSQEHIKGRGLQGRLGCQKSFTQIALSPNIRGRLGGCSGVL